MAVLYSRRAAPLHGGSREKPERKYRSDDYAECDSGRGVKFLTRSADLTGRARAVVRHVVQGPRRKEA